MCTKARLPSVVCYRQHFVSECDDDSTTAASAGSRSSGSISSTGSLSNEFFDLEDDVLGTGGFGVVRRARRRSSGLSCAVKVMSKKSSISFDMARHEIGMNALLDHPRICRMIASFEDERNIYLVFDLLHGHELFHEIAGGDPVGEDRVVLIMRQVLEGLRHCHAQSVIHRDVKPENVMISAASSATLIDFGLALKCVDVVSAPVVGTRCYMAPEAVMGLFRKASDMWSVGMMLTALLSGIIPSALNSAALTPSTTASLIDLVCTESAGHVIDLLLQRDPTARLTAAQLSEDPWLAPSMC